MITVCGLLKIPEVFGLYVYINHDLWSVAQIQTSSSKILSIRELNSIKPLQTCKTNIS